MKVHANLQKMWEKLSSGKIIYTVDNQNKIKKHINPSKKKIQGFEKDDRIKLILTSAMSYDSYERLVKKAKGKSFTELLDEHQKYWKDKDGKFRFI
jgi:hypothetical protein